MAARFATHALVMADGSAVSGAADRVLTDATLSAAFGHPVRRLDAGGSVAVVAL
jgi:ABC-type cobalamin/Fe3+-siderophores transport system ATPase subunit